MIFGNIVITSISYAQTNCRFKFDTRVCNILQKNVICLAQFVVFVIQNVILANINCLHIFVRVNMGCILLYV